MIEWAAVPEGGGREEREERRSELTGICTEQKKYQFIWLIACQKRFLFKKRTKFEIRSSYSRKIKLPDNVH